MQMPRHPKLSRRQKIELIARDIFLEEGRLLNITVRSRPLWAAMRRKDKSEYYAAAEKRLNEQEQKCTKE